MSNTKPLTIDTNLSPRDVDVVNEKTINIKQIFEKLEEDSFNSLSFFSQDMSNLSLIIDKYNDYYKVDNDNKSTKSPNLKDEIIGMIIKTGNSPQVSPVTNYNDTPGLPTVDTNFNTLASKYSSNFSENDFDQYIDKNSIKSISSYIDSVNSFKKDLNEILNGEKIIDKKVDLSEFGQTKPANGIDWVINIKSIIENIIDKANIGESETNLTSIIQGNDFFKGFERDNKNFKKLMMIGILQTYILNKYVEISQIIPDADRANNEDLIFGKTILRTLHRIFRTTVQKYKKENAGPATDAGINLNTEFIPNLIKALKKNTISNELQLNQTCGDILLEIQRVLYKIGISFLPKKPDEKSSSDSPDSDIDDISVSDKSIGIDFFGTGNTIVYIDDGNTILESEMIIPEKKQLNEESDEEKSQVDSVNSISSRTNISDESTSTTSKITGTTKIRPVFDENFNEKIIDIVSNMTSDSNINSNISFKSELSGVSEKTIKIEDIQNTFSQIIDHKDKNMELLIQNDDLIEGIKDAIQQKIFPTTNIVPNNPINNTEIDNNGLVEPFENINNQQISNTLFLESLEKAISEKIKNEIANQPDTIIPSLSPDTTHFDNLKLALGYKLNEIANPDADESIPIIPPPDTNHLDNLKLALAQKINEIANQPESNPNTSFLESLEKAISEKIKNEINPLDNLKLPLGYKLNEIANKTDESETDGADTTPLDNLKLALGYKLNEIANPSILDNSNITNGAFSDFESESPRSVYRTRSLVQSSNVRSNNSKIVQNIDVETPNIVQNIDGDKKSNIVQNIDGERLTIDETSPSKETIQTKVIPMEKPKNVLTRVYLISDVKSAQSYRWVNKAQGDEPDTLDIQTIDRKDGIEIGCFSEKIGVNYTNEKLQCSSADMLQSYQTFFYKLSNKATETGTQGIIDAVAELKRVSLHWNSETTTISNNYSKDLEHRFNEFITFLKENRFDFLEKKEIQAEVKTFLTKIQQKMGGGGIGDNTKLINELTEKIKEVLFKGKVDKNGNNSQIIDAIQKAIENKMNTKSVIETVNSNGNSTSNSQGKPTNMEKTDVTNAGIKTSQTIIIAKDINGELKEYTKTDLRDLNIFIDIYTKNMNNPDVLDTKDLEILLQIITFIICNIEIEIETTSTPTQIETVSDVKPIVETKLIEPHAQDNQTKSKVSQQQNKDESGQNGDELEQEPPDIYNYIRTNKYMFRKQFDNIAKLILNNIKNVKKVINK